jgi:hypothetical protein
MSSSDGVVIGVFLVDVGVVLDVGVVVLGNGSTTIGVIGVGASIG